MSKIPPPMATPATSSKPLTGAKLGQAKMPEKKGTFKLSHLMYQPHDEISKEEIARNKAREMMRAQEEAAIMAQFKDAPEEHDESRD